MTPVNSKDDSILPLQRELFDLPDDVAFLNCSFMSPQLRAVTRAGVEAVKQKATPWGVSGTEWLGGVEPLREAVANLMGADSDGIALIPAASYGIAIASANLPLRKGQNVVVLHEQFPSNVYAWRELAKARGAGVRTARKGPNDAWTEAVLDAIDEDTGIVAVPPCHWTDGAVVDLVRVAERSRAAGASLVVDASQALGVLPIDVAHIEPDFLISAGYKWMLGPYSLGYLYASPKWRELGRPLEASWMTRAGAENFAALVDYVDDYRPGARRFDMGEFSQFVLAPMALAGLTQILEWKVERLQSTIRRLTDLVAEEARALGCAVLAPDRRVGHMLGLRFPDGMPEALPRRLEQARVFVSVRGDAIRVSPHVYNSEGDVARFLAVLRDCM
jgi:selenocysteine lyase/cysteine desulfurase